jgi:hypothetical protein
MRIRHRLLLFLAITLGVIFVAATGLYFYSMAKLKNGLTYFHSQIVRNEGNVESLDIGYEGLGIQLPFGVKTKNLNLDITTTGSDQHVRISAEFIGGQLKGLPSGAMKVLARNIEMVSTRPDKPLLSNQYKIRNIEVQFLEYETYVSVLNPDQSMRRVYKHLAQLIDRGDTPSRLNMQGTVFFDFGKQGVIPQRFHTQTDGSLTRIILNRQDLDAVAPKFASRLSVGDLDLVANHPLKAPRLLEIRQQTEEKAREMRWAHKNFPEDVYRHVLWSYLLTKEYGADFAQSVTNAHEVGSYNSEEEIAKDRQNNRVGIAYAESRVPEGKLLEKIRSDPRIHY